MLEEFKIKQEDEAAQSQDGEGYYSVKHGTRCSEAKKCLAL